MKTKEFKTPFDYKRMSKSMIAEYDALFNDWLNRDTLNISRKYSSNYNFYLDCESFGILINVSEHGKSMVDYNTYKTLFYDVNSYIRSYAYDGLGMDCTRFQGRKVQNFFRSKFHDLMKSLLYTDTTSEEMVSNGHFVYDQIYTKKDLIEYSLKNCMEGVMCRGLSKKMTPNDYHSFQVCDDDGKYIKFTYRGSETKMKSGKAIRKILKCFGYTCSDEELKIMVNRLSSNFDGFELRVVSGGDITKYYNGENYDKDYDSGSLGSSCMRGKECGDYGYFEIYEDNCKMLVLINDERDVILGRAILWRAEDRNTGNMVNVMDRIYSSEKVYQKFFDWALANNYYRKRYQSYDNSTGFVSPEGMMEEMDFEIKIALDDYRYLPYMDTFAWGDSRVIRNDEYFGNYIARGTGGELEGRYDDDDNDDDDDDDKW